MTIKKKTATKTRKAATSITRKARRSSVSKKLAEAALRKGAQKVRPSDMENVIKETGKIEERFRTGPLSQFVDDLKLLLGIVGDYWNGNYREIPFWSIAAIVAALLYVLNPMDLIPDFIPVFGYVDDAAVIAACLVMVRQDLQSYAQWKASTA